ncbi:acyl-CoA dehydrogenase [Streptomyces sp. NPDC026673]|uniref:acyl-CoA dehydrogenase family protein n=1 Tax=Streptomyces sp. NPDC026673 TaxID=3155724 RepID=UPI0033E8471E
MNFQLAPQEGTAVAALTQAVFDDQFTEHHEYWRKLFSNIAFRFREGLLPEDRIALAYDRLRLVNEHIADPEDLVTDVARLAALHEWAGPVDAGMATIISIHYNLFLGSLVDHDGDRRDLREYLSMRRIGTFLCTEAGHGNSASQMETTAIYHPDTRTFTLHTPHPGARKFMPNTSSAGGSKAAVVAARLITQGTDHGIFLFLVPLSDVQGEPLPGIHISRLPQTATSPVDHCVTSFDHVPLSFEALLQSDHGRLTPDGTFTSAIGSARKRFLTSVGRVTNGKLCMEAYSLGVMRHAVTVAVRHGHSRQTTGAVGGAMVPLFAHRSHHAPLLDALATTYAATFLHRTAVRTWAQATAEQQEDSERLTAIAKGWVTWKAREVLTECRERCGAQGLMLSNGIAYQLAANEGTITAEGDNLVIWVKAAGELLLGNFTAQPARQLPAEDRALSDPAFLQDLLADLARIWHQRARTRLRSGTAGGPLGRWNRTVTPALKLVDAYAHHLAAVAMRDAASTAGHPDARTLLEQVHRLFALRRIAAYSGDLLAENLLTASQVRQLPDEIENVIDALAPHAMTLAAGFAVSEDILNDHPITHQGSGMVPCSVAQR